MLPPATRRYLLIALEGAPDVFDALLRAVPADDPAWDLRPDPERFTLREVMAHLAEWEDIFLERLTRTVHEDAPVLPDIDEGQRALGGDYAHQDPHANLDRFRAGRVRLVAFLRALEEPAWERVGHHTAVGPITVEAHAVHIAGHDGYHKQQAAAWLSKSR